MPRSGDAWWNTSNSCEMGVQLKFARLVLVLLGCAAIGGCSLLRLGYGQLDTIAAWMADDYFDLDRQQKEEFHRRFARLHDWHRYEQLPDYAAFLREIRRRVEKGLVRDDVNWVAVGLRERYAVVARRGADDAAALLRTITPQQIEALKRQFDKVNRRFVRDNKLDGTPQEKERARIKRVIAQVEEWVGHLSPEQEDRIAALVLRQPSLQPLRHEDRRRRQREFLALMEQRGNPAEFTPKLRDWLVNWEKGRAPEYERLQNETWEHRVAFFVAVDRMLTPQQRATLTRRLQNYADDFARLAERRSAQTAAQ
jgi:hypothetical protein